MSGPRNCPECGAVFGKVRSLADHRRLFGLLRVAFMNWPESYAEFQPTSAEHLRAWALVKAGYSDVTCVETEGFEGRPHDLFRLVQATMAAALAAGDFAFARPSAAGVEILRPKSISFASLSQKDFAPLREAVEEIVTGVVGVTAEELLRAEAA